MAMPRRAQIAVGLGTLALTTILTVDLASACSTNEGRGWARGGGSGTLTMAKGGKSCGGQIWVDPSARLPVSKLSVSAQPANGRVAIKGNTYSYTPKAGFAGQDRFSLSGSGKTAAGETATLTGTIAVTVN